MSITGGQRPTAGAYAVVRRGHRWRRRGAAEGSRWLTEHRQCVAAPVKTLRPTPPLVRPSPPSQEELRKWIQTEVARTCGGMAHLLTCT